MSAPVIPSDLKPCPFCGSPADLQTRSQRYRGMTGEHYVIVCSRAWKGCPASPIVVKDTLDEALAGWNRRAGVAWEPAT